MISLTATGLGVAVYRRAGAHNTDPLQTDLSVIGNADQHSERLMPAIHELLDSCGMAPADLAGVAFNAGPGGFTRVRVACAVAQGIAMGCGVPVAAIDSLQAAAVAVFASKPGNGDAVIAVCDDARMGECYAGLYSLSAGLSAEQSALAPVSLHVEQRAGLLPAADLSGWLDDLARRHASPGQSVLVVGDGLARYHPTALPPGLEPVTVPTAADTLHALVDRLAAQAFWQPADLVGPFYVREKVALNVTEQAALRAERKRKS